jgi:apolipoprotein N-acyltransferase
MTGENETNPPKWRARTARIGASALSGWLVSVGVPNGDAWWVGFLALVPWLWAIEGRRPRDAFLYGLVGGVVFTVLGYWWMTELLMRFAEFSLPVAIVVHVIFSFWQGSIWAWAALAVAIVRRRTGRSVLWVVPLAWVAVEAVLPALFPTYIGLIWCWKPILIQVAEIGGITTVSFVMVAINAAQYLALRTALAERRPHRNAMIALVAWVVGLLGYGTLRMRQIDARAASVEHIKVGVVQGNFGIQTLRDEALKPVLLAELQRVTARLETEGAQVALWGETAYPMTALNRERDADFEEDDDYRIRKGFSIPLIFGAATYDQEMPHSWNSVVVLRADGSISEPYDKVYPLLFGEAAPSFVDPGWYLRTIPNASHLWTGEGPKVLEVAGHRFGPLICYEDILPRYTRDTAGQGVHALVNLTNDSWFGRTREQGEHLGQSVFRAIEHRRPLLRAVNAGHSAYIDPAGRVHHRTEVTDSDTEGYTHAEGFVADVPMMDPDERTPFTITGDLFNGCTVLGLVVLGWRRRKREDAPRGSTG